MKTLPMLLLALYGCLPPLPGVDTEGAGDADVDADGDTDTDSGVQDTDTGRPDTETGHHDSDSGAENDLDGDGFPAPPDCNDYDPDVHPGADETCNGDDDDCDGLVDDDDPGLTSAPVWYPDIDGDGYGNAEYPVAGCEAPARYVADGTDCYDGDAGVHPGGTETCNGLDDDCDGTADDGVGPIFYADTDGDHYGDAAVSQHACTQPLGYVSNSADCVDSNSAAHPGQTVYQTVDRGDGSYDYDCDGVETKQYTHCSTTGIAGGCCWDEGWGDPSGGIYGATVVPSCGVNSRWVTSAGNGDYHTQGCL